MLVERVGDRTFLGEISDEVQTDTRESPLKLRLTRLAGQISRMGYLAAALVALIFLLNAFLFDTGFDRAVILHGCPTGAGSGIPASMPPRWGLPYWSWLCRKDCL